MASYFGNRTLTRKQLDAAMEMLRAERSANPVSLQQRQLFGLYRWAIWALCGNFIAAFVLAAHVKDDLEHEFGSFDILVFTFLGLSLLASIVLFALNLKLMVQTAREVRVAVRSRLWRLAKPGTHRPTWVQRALLIPKTYAWLLLIVALGVAVLSDGIVILFVAPIAGYFFLWSARRRLARLDDADRLVQSLAGLQTGSGDLATVSVPDEVFRKVAQIEEQQVERKRTEALAELDTSAAGRAVVRSRRLVEQLSQTNPTDRLRIERCIADLTDAPARPGAPVVETVAVPDTGRSINIRRDAQQVRIEVLELSESGRTGPVEEVARG